jgi:hypothetical protein
MRISWVRCGVRPSHTGRHGGYPLSAVSPLLSEAQMSLILLILIIVLLLGGGWGYSYGGWTGYGPGGLVGLLVIVLIIFLLVGGRP